VTLREKVAFYLVDCNTPLGKLIDVVLTLINLLACGLFVVWTYPHSETTERLLYVVELVVVAIFIVEYAARFWVAERKLAYFFSFYALVDLASILPALVTIRGLNFLRVFRVLRIFRFIRFLETEVFFFGTITRVHLQIVRTLFTILAIVFTAAGFIYFAEYRADDSQVHTFGDAFYFSVTTLTTVGFGDIVPLTRSGRLVTVLMILSGVICIPWQAGKLVRLLVTAESGKVHIVCPSCGLRHHDPDATHCKSCGAVIYHEVDGSS